MKKVIIVHIRAFTKRTGNHSSAKCTLRVFSSKRSFERFMGTFINEILEDYTFKKIRCVDSSGLSDDETWIFDTNTRRWGIDIFTRDLETFS